MRAFFVTYMLDVNCGGYEHLDYLISRNTDY